MKKVEVLLNGENGQRRLEVNQRGGFYTRHIRCPRPEVPSIFGNDVSLGESTTLPQPSETTETPTFTPDALLDIIEKMTDLDQQDGAQAGGWHCEDAIFKVAHVNLRIDVSAESLRSMLFDLVESGTLQHKTAYGLNKFRLSVASPNALQLQSLLMEVDAILAGGVDNA